MRVIEREQVPLQPPGRDELDRTYAQLKQIHGEAYGWDPPDVAGLERLPSNRMRQYVRAWINEWDLLRLDPGYQPRISVAGLDVDLDRPTVSSRGAPRRAERSLTTSPAAPLPARGDRGRAGRRAGRTRAGGVGRPLRRPRPVPERPRSPPRWWLASDPGARTPARAGRAPASTVPPVALSDCTRGSWKRSTRGDAEAAGGWWRRSPARARRWWAWPPR